MKPDFDEVAVAYSLTLVYSFDVVNQLIEQLLQLLQGVSQNQILDDEDAAGLPKHNLTCVHTQSIEASSQVVMRMDALRVVIDHKHHFALFVEHHCF